MVNQRNAGEIITAKQTEAEKPVINQIYKPGTLDEILRELLRPIVREILELEAESNDKKDSGGGSEKPKDKRYYTRDEVCEKLKICRATFHNWACKGKLTRCRIGGRVYIEAESLDQALKEGEVKKFTKFRIKPLKK